MIHKCNATAGTATATDDWFEFTAKYEPKPPKWYQGQKICTCFVCSSGAVKYDDSPCWFCKLVTEGNVDALDVCEPTMLDRIKNGTDIDMDKPFLAAASKWYEKGKSNQIKQDVKGHFFRDEGTGQ